MRVKIKAKAKLFSIFVLYSLTGTILVVFLLAYINEIKLFFVESGSMEPTIKTHSLIVVKPQTEYQKGEIVTYKINSGDRETTTHRITDILREDNQNKYLTRGDANNGNDFVPIKHTQIVGKTIFQIPFVGYFPIALGTKTGLFFIVLLPTILIIGKELRQIKKALSKTQDGPSDNQKMNYKRITLLQGILVGYLFLAGINSTQSYFITTRLIVNNQLQAAIQEIHLEVFEDKNTKTVGFKIQGNGLTTYTEINYLITYDSDQGIQAIKGKQTLNNREEIIITDLPLGSYSDGGSFTPNTGINTVNFEVILTGKIETKLNKELVI